MSVIHPRAGIPMLSVSAPGTVTVRRGLFFFLVASAAAVTMLALMLAYVLLVEAAGIFLGWSFYLTANHLTTQHSLAALDWLRLGGLAVGVGVWLAVLRPLLPRPRASSSALPVNEHTQPELFDLLKRLCVALRIHLPAEVWLDNSAHVRLAARGGIKGVLGGKVALHIGLPFLTTATARELAATLAGELAAAHSGLMALPQRFVREASAWLFRAYHGRYPWELEVNQERGGWIHSLAWLPQRLFWLIKITGSVLWGLVVRLERKTARETTSQLLSNHELAALNARKKLRRQAWDKALAEVRMNSERRCLTNNFTLLVTRLFYQDLHGLDDALPYEHDIELFPSSAALLNHLPAGADGADLIPGLIDLAHQVSSIWCQHELRLATHTMREVPEDETLFARRHAGEKLSTIRRYFGGLAHPERALTGLGRTWSTFPGAQVLIGEIAKSRAFAQQYGKQMKAGLKEWNTAWRRRRDLEAAWVLSLAGYSVCRLDFGVENSTPETFRKEAGQQRLIMDHLEDALCSCEARLEKRMAAALGLLWWAHPEKLPEKLRALRAEMPHRAPLYEALASVMADFRELLTSFHSFQTLERNFAGRPMSGCHATAVQSLVPGMLTRAGAILRALDGATWWPVTDAGAMPLALYLSPQTNGVITFDPAAAAGMHEMAQKLVADATIILDPMITRFLDLYHESFAWLASTARHAEAHFLSVTSQDMLQGNDLGEEKPATRTVERDMVLA